MRVERNQDRRKSMSKRLEARNIMTLQERSKQVLPIERKVTFVGVDGWNLEFILYVHVSSCVACRYQVWRLLIHFQLGTISKQTLPQITTPFLFGIEFTVEQISEICFWPLWILFIKLWRVRSFLYKKLMISCLMPNQCILSSLFRKFTLWYRITLLWEVLIVLVS